MHNTIVNSLFIILTSFFDGGDSANPLVINTWNFDAAAAAAWNHLQQNATAVEALVVGCTVCEVTPEECRFSVGFGGNPDENGEPTLDALIFDGATMNMGAVAGLRNIKNAITVAKHVLDYTEHSLLAGDLATAFAVSMGFTEEPLNTTYSNSQHDRWLAQNCSPNFWINVHPDPAESCGPYTPLSTLTTSSNQKSTTIDVDNHDTIGMIVIDGNGNIAAGTSTNGLIHKIAGRVGDSPLPGAGAYADNEVGAAVATGNGDIMMRFLPTFLAVEEMRRGSSPTEAAQTAIKRISSKYPDFSGALIAVNKEGGYGMGCNGRQTFTYSVASHETEGAVPLEISCSGSNPQLKLGEIYLFVLLGSLYSIKMV